MNSALLSLIPSALAQLPAPGGQAQQQPPADAASALQLYSLFHGFDWKWMLLFGIAAFMIFGIIIFGIMLMRRWSSTRFGFFMLTIIVGVVRALKPNDRVWLVPAVAGVVLAASLLIGYFARKEDHRRANLKEPIYFLLNAFALCMFILPFNGYSYSAAASAVFASLFFLVSIAPKNKEKYKKRVADPAILESLEKRVEKNRRGMR